MYWISVFHWFCRRKFREAVYVPNLPKIQLQIYMPAINNKEKFKKLMEKKADEIVVRPESPSKHLPYILV